MTDIFFIFPSCTHEDRYAGKNIGDVGGNLPPLGILYLASYLRQHKFSVAVEDAATSRISDEDLMNKIRGCSPKVVGISALTPTYHRVVKIVENIRKEFDDILIVIGGQHATIEPAKTLAENPGIDLLVFGEGEYTLLELIRQYKKAFYVRKDFLNNKLVLGSIKGLSYRDNQEAVINLPREPIQDLDALPDPAWDLVDVKKYIPLPNQYLRKPVFHMLVIRGCPFDCTFCSCAAVFGKKIRKTSPGRVVKMIKRAMADYGVREISFWDDTITSSKSWITELCTRIIDEKLNITWTCLSRVDTITRDMLVLMKKAGCWNIFFGFEAKDQILLDNINKHITADMSRQVMKWMKEVGIEARASFMLALPGETPDMALDTIKFAIELDPDYAQFCITTPYPGTKLFRDVKKYGTMHHQYSKYSLWHPVFIPFGYKNVEEIKKMEQLAMRKFYFRPRYIYNRLKKIKTLEDLSRNLKGLRMAIGMTK
jgi:anaerobic magnesium-protoporphyrin IX monomethyl ester cyclase